MDNTDWLKCLNDLLESPNGAGVSGGLHTVAAAAGADGFKEPMFTAPCISCGNGSLGIGFPGERQVNSAGQDNDSSPNITQSETSIAAFGSYILFGFNDSNRATSGNFSGFAFSSDAGITWSDCGSMPQNMGWTNGGDPVTAVDRNGIFYYSHLGTTNAGQSVIQISTGTVDQRAKRLCMNFPFAAGEGNAAGRFQDKEWMAVGPDRLGRRCAEAIYLTWTDFPNATDPNIYIRFAKWTTGVQPRLLIASKTIVTGAALQNSFPVVDQWGNIYVFYEDFNGDFLGNTRAIKMVRSFDGGQTFSTPILVSNVTRAGTIENCLGGGTRTAILVAATKVIRIQEPPAAAVGPDGTLYVVWHDGVNNTPTGTGIDIFLAYSTNEGANWSIRQITNTATHEFFPSVTANYSGAHIQYSRFIGTTGVGNGRFALFMKSFNINRGLSPETMVSTSTSLVPDTRPNFDPNVASCYMGDYNQIITGPDGVLYHAWGDNRNNPLNGNNPDVFFIQTGQVRTKPCHPRAQNDWDFSLWREPEEDD